MIKKELQGVEKPYFIKFVALKGLNIFLEVF